MGWRRTDPAGGERSGTPESLVGLDLDVCAQPLTREMMDRVAGSGK